MFTKKPRNNARMKNKVNPSHKVKLNEYQNVISKKRYMPSLHRNVHNYIVIKSRYPFQGAYYYQSAIILMIIGQPYFIIIFQKEVLNKDTK